MNDKDNETELMNKCIDQLLNEMNEDKNIFNNMISNNSYIEWLEKYISSYQYCSSEDFYKDDCSKEDRVNIDNMNLFYDKVSTYAFFNGIFPKEDLFYLKYNDQIYCLGKMVGQGVLYIFTKVKTELNEFVISYDDMFYGNNIVERKNVVDDINTFESIITNLYRYNVKYKSIEFVILSLCRDNNNHLEIIFDETFRDLSDVVSRLLKNGANEEILIDMVRNNLITNCAKDLGRAKKLKK